MDKKLPLTPKQRELYSLSARDASTRYLEYKNNQVVNFKKEFEDGVNTYYLATKVAVFPILYLLKAVDLNYIFASLDEYANILGTTEFKFNTKAILTDLEALLKEKEVEILKDKPNETTKTQAVIDTIKFFTNNIILNKAILPMKQNKVDSANV